MGSPSSSRGLTVGSQLGPRDGPDGVWTSSAKTIGSLRGCHRITVSGRTMASASRAFGNRWQDPTQDDFVCDKQGQPARPTSMQHNNLLSQYQDLGFQRCS